MINAMDQQPLSDNILKRQVCTNCLQYLSVLPVTINKKGDILCGRCNVDSSEDNISHSKSLLFNTVARHYLFKCVNHFEGCTRLLDVKKTLNHEVECQYENHECFFCSFTGNWCQIINHCINQHPSKMTQDGTFQFTVGSELTKRMVYVAKSSIFLFTIKITEEKLILNISPETRNDFGINQFAVKFYLSSDPQNDALFAIEYELFDINSINIFEKDMEYFVLNFGRKTVMHCEIILKQVELSQKELELERRWLKFKSHEINLNKQKISVNKREFMLQQQQETLDGFSKLLKQISLHFKCVNCQKIITDSIYLCPKSHFYCETCLSGTCKSCNKITDFVKVLEFSKIMVSCDWPNCQNSVSVPNYLKHKYSCSLRPYKCPLNHCFETIYSHEKFKNHWHCQVPPLVTEDFLEYSEYKDYECYWLIDTELYHVITRFFYNNLQIMIENINVLSDNINFKTEGFVADWQALKSVDFCGRYQVICNNKNSAGQYFKKIKISVTSMQ